MNKKLYVARSPRIAARKLGEEMLEVQNGYMALCNIYLERNWRQLHHQETK